MAGWLLLEGDQRPVPVVQGSADFEYFDLYQLIRDAESSKKRKSADAPQTGAGTGFKLPAIHGKISLNAETFRYRDVEFSALKAPFELSPGYYHCPELRAAGMDGTVKLKTNLRQSPSGMLTLEVSGRLEGLEVEEVFRQFENFGQKELTYKHLKGKLYGQVNSLSATWDRAFKIQQEDFRADMHVEIEKGELVKYEPLMALSGFIKVDALEHIEFSRLENKITISNRNINIPVMQINSSAMNLLLAGTHSFDNQVDYNVRGKFDGCPATQIPEKPQYQFCGRSA